MKTCNNTPLPYSPLDMISAPKQKVYSYPQSSEIETFRDRLLEALRLAPPQTTIPVSLKKTILNGSCHAAVIGVALSQIIDGSFPQRYVVVYDPDGTNDWDADAALKKESKRLGKKLVCSWHGPDNTPMLIGDVDPNVKSTFDFVLSCYQEGMPATARGLAEEFDLKIQAASNRMSKVASLGLVHCAEEESVPGGGSQNVYVPVI